LPLLLVTMFLGVMASLVQTRFNISFKLLTPKFSKLNPMQGLGRIFSQKNVVELIKNIIKIKRIDIKDYFWIFKQKNRRWIITLWRISR